MAANRDHLGYHVDKWGDTWHFAYPGDGGMEPIWTLGEHQHTEEGVSAVVLAAQEWVAQVVHEKGAAASTGVWRVGVVHRTASTRIEGGGDEGKQIYPPVERTGE